MLQCEEFEGIEKISNKVPQKTNSRIFFIYPQITVMLGQKQYK